eukprot:4055785-Amphidinium_carterae.1
MAHYHPRKVPLQRVRLRQCIRITSETFQSKKVTSCSIVSLPAVCTKPTNKLKKYNGNRNAALMPNVRLASNE